MKLSLSERLLRYLKARPGVRVPSGELQRLVTAKTKYTASNATRRLRELAESGDLKVEYIKGHAVYYYEPTGTRTVRKIEIVNGVAKEVYQQVSV